MTALIAKPINAIRSLTARVLLRGSLHDFWCRRKFLKLEKIFLQNAVASSATPPAVPPAPKKTGTTLKKLAFIADIMWEANELIPELQKICEVETLNLRSLLRNVTPENLPAAVVQNVAGFISDRPTPDAVLFYARGSLLSEEVFSLIRKHWPCPLLGMNLDDKASFWPSQIFAGNDGDYKKWARLFDVNITSCRIASGWYEREGARCVYSPPGVHIPPGVAEPTSADFKYPLSFLGTRKLDRETLVNRLRDAGLPVAVFGQGWPHTEWVSDPKMIFRASQINLGLGAAMPNLTAIKARDFECPGVGACYLTTYNWELANFWDIGREILCYRNVEELIEMLAWYRHRPEDCLKIAQAAWRRSVAEHTWEKRFRKIFREAGFDV